MNHALTSRGLTRAQLHGYTIVPLLTPATADGEVDFPAVNRQIEHIVAGGCQGLMVCGTTGEFASLTVAQRIALVQQAVATVAGRAVVFGGIGDTCPAHSVALAEAFFAAGADAVVANLPSYYPLTSEMMERYFLGLAEKVGGPMYLYNIPQTTRQSVPLDVLERLSRHPRIVGLKDSEPDGDRLEAVARLFKDREDFAVFCGTVPFTSRFMRAGGDGYVPGAGNFVPAVTSALMKAHVAGGATEADAIQAQIDAINATYQKGRTIAQLFGALKAILEIMGLAERNMFPPLLPASDAEVAEIRGKLQELGVVA
jgi:4-hydroxy-tetrahydrodipicolinate synthase